MSGNLSLLGEIDGFSAIFLSMTKITTYKTSVRLLSTARKIFAYKDLALITLLNYRQAICGILSNHIEKSKDVFFSKIAGVFFTIFAMYDSTAQKDPELHEMNMGESSETG